VAHVQPAGEVAAYRATHVTLPILIRDLAPSERAMVLSDWKLDIRDERPSWGVHMLPKEWWALVNYVVDRITYPSSTVVVACHRDEPMVPLAWLAHRSSQIIGLSCRAAIRKDPELAARIQTELLGHIGFSTFTPFNPFEELKRP
jgi:hypothetical protein